MEVVNFDLKDFDYDDDTDGKMNDLECHNDEIIRICLSEDFIPLVSSPEVKKEPYEDYLLEPRIKSESIEHDLMVILKQEDEEEKPLNNLAT